MVNAISYSGDLCEVRSICGVLLTVIATFIADTFTTSNEPVGSPQTIVNWDLLGKRVSASVDTIREEVHELTR